MSPTVLIAEDDEDLVFLYQTALGQKGYNTVEARTNARLMQLLNDPEFAPQLVLLDIEMPDARSLEAVDFIRREPRFADTRIIVITANENYREKIEKKVDHYLVKPIAISHLITLADESAG